MTYEVSVGGRTLTLELRREGERFFVRVEGGEEQVVDTRRSDPSQMSLLVGGRSYSVGLAERPDGWDVDLRGTPHACAVVDPRRKALRLSGAASEGTLSTSMPGKVVRLLVAIGDVVAEGDPVAVVEAMKMENELKAPLGGRVAEIPVAAGEAVDAGAVILRIEGEDP